MRRTRAAFLWTWICNSPFWAIYTMFTFILYKDLHATPLQITVSIALKPLVSIFSMYWSAWINKRKDRLIANVILAGIIGHLPFFFFPFVDNPWYFVVSFGFYMLMARGSLPAWMEILKLNIPGTMREKVFAYASTFEYLGGGILPLALGWMLDGYSQSWRWLFPVTALISILSAFIQYRIPIKQDLIEPIAVSSRIDVIGQIMKPWKDAWELIRTRKDFAVFQIGFMLGGSGVLVVLPILPAFYEDVLQLSYTELALAVTLCKGVGFALTSSLWAKWIHKVGIYRFIGTVTCVACLFPLCLIGAQFNLAWVYIGHIIYGIMLAGSELSWSMSGPIFAKHEDSSVFTNVNLVTVGIRGCFVPAIGSFLYYGTGPMPVMVLAATLCLLATWSMLAYEKRFDKAGLLS